MANPRFKQRAPRPGGGVPVMYVGVQPGVTVAATGTYCPFGVPVELPAGVAERLLRQSCWAPAPPAAEPAAPPVDEKEQ